MLKELKKKRLVPYSKLLTLVKDNITSGEYLFAPALNFLFLLGLVEYQPKTDMLEFIENRP
ncbi:ABC-three component system middle component 8 [uncultured Psychrobacter sp.]